MLLRRTEDVTVFETYVAIHVAWEGYAVFFGVRGQPGHCVTCAESSEEFKFRTLLMYIIIFLENSSTRGVFQ